MDKKFYQAQVILITVLMLNGCVSTTRNIDKVSVEQSFLSDNEDSNSQVTPIDNKNATKENHGFTKLQSIDKPTQAKLEVDLANKFSSEKEFQLSANELPLNEFVHYVLGELLNVSYFIDPEVKKNIQPVTLSLQNVVTERRLFQLAQDILANNDVRIALNEDIFYIYPASKDQGKTDMAFGFGRTEGSVPLVSSTIYQMVPMDYDVSLDTRTLLNALLDAKSSVDPAQNLVRIEGTREQVLRALEIIEIIDVPTFANKAIAMVDFKYIDSSYFIDKATQLLSEEGINANITDQSRAVTFVPLEYLGKIIVFATSEKVLNRIKYWSKVLDKPATGSEQSFYIYRPQYARASDIGKSLVPLLKGGISESTSGSDNSGANVPESANRPSKPSAPASSFSVQGDDMRLVVDERANALIFYSTGKYYQDLQPIIKQLDIMPQQIMMEVVIAEVKLTGGFSKGVQFALRSGASSSTTERFNFDSESGFRYSIVGLPGNVNLNLNQKEGLVNVLSRPTLLVRDGVSANISVGDDIPTVGSTTSDPINGERETTTIQYRKTGVDLNVTPTINAQGTVIMTIEQKISNVNSEAGGSSRTPAIFERSLSTEVVAGNGQTVLLGGLISQNTSEGGNSVPGLGSLPLLGHLFRSDTSSTDKTELVVLVTPKIVKSSDDWVKIKQSFKKGLENLDF
ncbi:secretin N-terminal domain-containing protein [Pseudoalteromonas sp. JC3]|uniref:secretin N-terminal domain-containing protein n=1 Tax=Pseudoalteromonas sp. JC3 TaxID=2810196 RepID=UPI0020C14067|nr:secretin N-terminal domain-containing protein [Pseudoalteromonas sp. JC3]WJE09396.1 secretin N-terminal domain-containing protein [Pseudoalteromonas sp. JC3]